MARAPASARRFLALPLAALPLLSLAAPPAVAQDNNYWSLQYGPVAELLGGTIVGSALDLSSTYYNPGGLALAEDPAFLLSLNTSQLEQLSLDAPPPSFDLSSCETRSRRGWRATTARHGRSPPARPGGGGRRVFT